MSFESKFQGNLHAISKNRLRWPLDRLSTFLILPPENPCEPRSFLRLGVWSAFATNPNLRDSDAEGRRAHDRLPALSVVWCIDAPQDLTGACLGVSPLHPPIPARVHAPPCCAPRRAHPPYASHAARRMPLRELKPRNTCARQISERHLS